MTSPLTVRNLTSKPISITRIERFEDPNTLQSKAKGYLSSSNTTSTAPSAPKLGQHAQSFNHQQLDVTLKPFESYTLSSQIRNEDDTALSCTLRITIQATDGERHRVDTNPSYSQKSTQTFTPLSPNPSTNFTALFHPSNPTSHLTIRSDSTDYKKWMAALPDTLPLSAISIPGTHNSHTYYRALPSVKCQHVDVQTQLENGIRFLDIRVQPAHATDRTKKDLYLVHGAFPISLTGPKYLAPVLETCTAFLAANPSETILVSLKREGTGAATDAHLAHILATHYIAPQSTAWYTARTIPYLGAARGKLVLVRRYASDDADTALGLDATTWPHNSPSASHPPFAIQDFCELMHPASIPAKAQYANAHLARAAGQRHAIPGATTDAVNPVPPGDVYLNFLSGANFWRRACWPERIAGVVNRGVEEWVCKGHWLADGEVGEGGVTGVGEGDGGTGVVVMDCVGKGGDWDLVRLVVGMNEGVLGRIRELEGAEGLEQEQER
jgi:1-phosphatidylinositol phosphodiesterase